jgi:hypothetical protein
VSKKIENSRDSIERVREGEYNAGRGAWYMENCAIESEWK